MWQGGASIRLDRRLSSRQQYPYWAGPEHRTAHNQCKGGDDHYSASIS